MSEIKEVEIAKGIIERNETIKKWLIGLPILIAVTAIEIAFVALAIKFMIWSISIL